MLTDSQRTSKRDIGEVLRQQNLALESIGPYRADTLFVNEDGDTIVLQLNPLVLIRMAGIRVRKGPGGVLYTARFSIAPTNNRQRFQQAVFSERCRWQMQEIEVEDYTVTVDFFQNQEFLFRTNLRRQDFRGILDSYTLNRQVVTDFDFLEYNETQQLLWVTLKFGERYDSEWYSDLFALLDLDGRVVHLGVLDASSACIDGYRFSPNRRYITSCVGIYDIQRHKLVSLGNINPSLVQFMADSILVLTGSIWHPDSLHCDERIITPTDTLWVHDFDRIPDTTASNVFILRFGKDTLAHWRYDAPISRLNYRGYFAYSPRLKAIAFYHRLSNALWIVPTDGPGRRIIKIPLQSPPNLNFDPETTDYFEFWVEERGGGKLKLFVSKTFKLLGTQFLPGKNSTP